MNGDERKRFCAQCGKHVFNLSAMTEREAKDFAEETQGRECVSYVPTGDGRIHTPNPFERRLLWLSARLPRMAAMLALLLPAALVSCVQRLGGSVCPPSSKETLGAHPANSGVQRVVPGMPARPKGEDPPSY